MLRNLICFWQGHDWHSASYNADLLHTLYKIPYDQLGHIVLRYKRCSRCYHIESHQIVRDAVRKNLSTFMRVIEDE